MTYPYYSYNSSSTFGSSPADIFVFAFIIAVILFIFGGLFALIINHRKKKEESYINRFVFNSKLLFSSDLSIYKPINKKRRRKEKSARYNKLPPTPDEMV
ncbi:hypothetical protein CONCODRAFT_13174 [Conidiobolus coronatus NRRL 28638]|uniref:Uncharacterized protein n=1 Tax=Conidiobolus coronatus (strain ATCC 28846 / CBS 209.66 / NRRL 28638) TaxID=796925 RepID=A0A137NR92_CONC2|nr:hypothetical protein CONCODRAFT_13174 [Conidiobolus coronatus NRRL 28638]|eukprot:KXN65286.1 hypothetical protein CONCODRAFT_13174 [Conidiobolus coronatus NRRL 28638]